jgi:membrane-bound lytic murein transglycosylase MltF
VGLWFSPVARVPQILFEFEMYVELKYSPTDRVTLTALLEDGKLALEICDGNKVAVVQSVPPEVAAMLVLIFQRVVEK